MYLENMVSDPAITREWAEGWINAAANGLHRPVKTIQETAMKIKKRFCTNGLWAPGAKEIYNYLMDSAEIAQSAYEDAQPSME